MDGKTENNKILRRHKPNEETKHTKTQNQQ